MTKTTYRVITKHNYAEFDYTVIEALKSLGMLTFKGSEAVPGGGRRYVYAGVNPA